MTDKIRLARNLVLPVDFATQTSLVVGKRGSGKTNTTVVMAEELYRAQIPFAVIDPADVWWGLKASGDGTKRGLGVYVFGGRHADVPLEANAGRLVADVIIEHRISAVFSVKHFSGAERSRFVTDFCRRLFQQNKEPIHLFLEEAHEVAPQDQRKADATPESIGAIHRLWKLGRSSGVGGSAVTQRPASLSKNVTTQAEILIVHRTIGPQDRDAIKAWIEYHGERDEILSHLSALKTGEAFVWAPDFPEDEPIGLVRVKIRARRTFDSSATPKVGAKRAEPKELAPVDLEALRDRMASTLERAEANDPSVLKRELLTAQKRIRELEASPAQDERTVEDAYRKGHEDGSAQQREADENAIQALLDPLQDLVRGHAESLARGVERIVVDADSGDEVKPGPIPSPLRPVKSVPKKAKPAPRSTGSASPDRDGLDGPQRRILDEALAMREMGFSPVRRAQLAVFCGYLNPRSGGFSEPLGQLVAAGLMAIPHGGSVELTDAGTAAAVSAGEAVTVASVQRRVLDKLDGPQRRLLEDLIGLWPQDTHRRDLAKRLGYENPRSGGFSEPAGFLIKLGLATKSGAGRMRAANMLFLED